VLCGSRTTTIARTTVPSIIHPLNTSATIKQSPTATIRSRRPRAWVVDGSPSRDGSQNPGPTRPPQISSTTATRNHWKPPLRLHRQTWITLANMPLQSLLRANEEADANLGPSFANTSTAHPTNLPTHFLPRTMKINNRMRLRALHAVPGNACRGQDPLLCNSRALWPRRITFQAHRHRS